jgi:hypothetical protein
MISKTVRQLVMQIFSRGFFALILLWIVSIAPAHAKEQISDFVLTQVAEISSIEISNRTAVIGGYRYFFSGLQGWDHPSVKLVGSDSGAFEILTPGMWVEVTYRRSPSRRIVESLQVLDPATLDRMTGEE